MNREYDIVFLGGGPAGYVGAIYAAKLGLRVAIVERDKLGGTCLHKGCIPTKALLRSAELYRQMKSGETYGVLVETLRFDIGRAHARKAAIVETLHKGIQYLIKKRKIDVYQGHGRLFGPSIFSPHAGAISVSDPSGGEGEVLTPKHVIIATGSRPRLLPGLPIDGKRIITSDEALALESVPQSVAIVGGGVIGIEWASFFADLGANVTVIEAFDRILPLEDEEISREMVRALKKKGVRVITSANLMVPSVRVRDDGVTLDISHRGGTETLLTDILLVAVGRTANIEDIGLENTNIRVENGVIRVNDVYQTDEKHIYAVGDVIGGLMLAHVASHEAIRAVDHITGRGGGRIDERVVPKATYSAPEVASIGLTEQAAREAGFAVKVGKMPFRANGKALIEGEADGFIKIVMDEATQDVLGVHMIGPHATELISEASLAKLLDAVPWEIARAIHPHPTLSETIGEASLAIDGMEIHA